MYDFLCRPGTHISYWDSDDNLKGQCVGFGGTERQGCRLQAAEYLSPHLSLSKHVGEHMMVAMLICKKNKQTKQT